MSSFREIKETDICYIMMGTGLAPYILEGKVLKTTNFGPNDLIILSVFFHVIIFTFSANRRGFLYPLFGWNPTHSLCLVHEI
jgi:hypothetical protein